MKPTVALGLVGMFLAVAGGLPACGAPGPVAGSVDTGDVAAAPPSRDSQGDGAPVMERRAVISAPPVLDAGTAPPPTGCAPEVGGAIFCDSFEASAIGATWTELRSSGDAELTTARALTGAQSLILGFSPLPSRGRAELERRDAAIAASSVVSMRFHVFLPRDGYPDHLPLGGIFDSNGNGVRVALDRSAQLVTNGQSLPFTLGQWSCVALTVDRANGAFTLDLDGTTTQGELATTGATVFDRARIGLTYDEGANPGASTAAWYDDFALATAPLGCN